MIIIWLWTTQYHFIFQKIIFHFKSYYAILFNHAPKKIYLVEKGTDIMSLLLYLWTFLETWILLHSLKSEIFFSFLNLIHFTSKDYTEEKNEKL